MSQDFSREIEPKLIKFINTKQKNKNVALLMGARQVGKSTLVKKIISKLPHLFLNLEEQSSLVKLIDKCEEFKGFENLLKDQFNFKPQQQILVFDEAQESEKIGSFVRFMKEKWNNSTVLMTGSVLSEVYRTTKRRPVGRESFFELWPLSFKEFLEAMQQKSLAQKISQYHLGDSISDSQHERFLHWFDEYLKVGGLPEVIQYYQQKKDYIQLRRDLLKSYEDDFIRYFSLDEINLFRRCLQAVANNLGSPSKDTQVVRLDAPGYKKVSSIFARLEKWRLVLKCEQYGRTPEKASFYSKRYLYDIGVARDMRLRGMPGISIQEMTAPLVCSSLGGLIENSLALALRQRFGDQLFGIKLSRQTEIDFAIKHREQVFPIECKISPRFKKNYLSSLRHYLSEVNPNSTGYLFYGGKPLQFSEMRIFALPFYLAEANIFE